MCIRDSYSDEISIYTTTTRNGSISSSVEYLEVDMCHNENKRNTTCDINSSTMETIDSQQFGIDNKSDLIFDWHPPWQQDSNGES